MVGRCKLCRLFTCSMVKSMTHRLLLDNMITSDASVNTISLNNNLHHQSNDRKASQLKDDLFELRHFCSKIIFLLFNSWHPNLVCFKGGIRRTEPRHPEYRLKWPGIRRTKKGVSPSFLVTTDALTSGTHQHSDILCCGTDSV